MNWSVPTVKPTSTYKKLDQDFLTMLAQCDIKQLVTDPTHIHGDTLNLLCSSRPDHLMNTTVKCPGVSGHFIITASVIIDVSTSIRSNYTAKLYRDVDVDSFQQDMERMKHKLSEINNVDDTWTLFSITRLRAVDKHVPKKTKYYLFTLNQCGSIVTAVK